MPKLWQDFILAQKIIKEKHLVHFIVILLILLNIFSLRHFTLVDRDEGDFALHGQWLATIGAQGKPFNFQTPPLYQILIAILFRLFQINVIILPLLSIIFSCVTIYLIFHLAKVLYSQQVGLYSIIFFATTEFYLFFSKSGRSDATFVCFFIASLFFFSKGLESNRANQFLLAGLLTTLALYTKYSAFPLLVIFFIIGLLYRNRINKKWFILSIMVPILLYLPYTYLFIRFVQISEIGRRHVSLLGINHIKFLFYTLIFAPIPFFLTIGYTIFNIKNVKRWNIYLLTAIAIFFLILGFYYPYFRLAYPIIPLLSIVAAKFVMQTGRYKPYITVAAVLISLTLCMKTLSYKSDVPERISKFAEQYAKKENIKYIYAIVPPNIYFYVNGTIAIPAGHPWLLIGKHFPVFLKGKKIMYPDSNELLTEEKVLLIHATIRDSIKHKNLALYSCATRLKSIEFEDAPVYYKDIYNTHRNFKQIYEIYLFNNKIMGNKINDLWNLGFSRRVTVKIRQ